jgi:hypothetical protein
MNEERARKRISNDAKKAQKLRAKADKAEGKGQTGQAKYFRGEAKRFDGQANRQKQELDAELAKREREELRRREKEAKDLKEKAELNRKQAERQRKEAEEARKRAKKMLNRSPFPPGTLGRELDDEGLRRAGVDEANARVRARKLDRYVEAEQGQAARAAKNAETEAQKLRAEAARTEDPARVNLLRTQAELLQYIADLNKWDRQRAHQPQITEFGTRRTTAIEILHHRSRGFRSGGFRM